MTANQVVLATLAATLVLSMAAPAAADLLIPAGVFASWLTLVFAD